MSLFSSPALIYTASALSLLLLLGVSTGQSPFRSLRSALSAMRRDARAWQMLLALGAVLATNALQLRWETAYGPPGAIDYTAAVARLGTGLIYALQRLEWPPVTHLLTYVYVILFPLLGVCALILFLASQNWSAMRRLVIAFLVNYLVAIPFYLFVPVREAWAADKSIRFLIPTVYPAFEVDYRPLSGLDNCFPSLHTSLALTFALVAWRSGNRRLAIALTTGAALVMLSTLYLGVHWVVDLVGGALLAAVATGPIPDLLLRPRASRNALVLGSKSHRLTNR